MYIYICLCLRRCLCFMPPNSSLFLKRVRIITAGNRMQGMCHCTGPVAPQAAALLTEIFAKGHEPRISVSLVSPVHGCCSQMCMHASGFLMFGYIWLSACGLIDRRHLCLTNKNCQNAKCPLPDAMGNIKEKTKNYYYQILLLLNMQYQKINFSYASRCPVMFKMPCLQLSLPCLILALQLTSTTCILRWALDDL